MLGGDGGIEMKKIYIYIYIVPAQINILTIDLPEMLNTHDML